MTGMVGGVNLGIGRLPSIGGPRRPSATGPLAFPNHISSENHWGEFGYVPNPAQQIEKGVFEKHNFAVRNLNDRSFNHLVSVVFHPEKIDRSKPMLVFEAGILCNGNLARISWAEDNFRDLNNPTSLVNALANEGYAVAIIHRRSAAWIYSRYANETLGIPNDIPKNVSFEKGVDDFHFLIDAVLEIGRKIGVNASQRIVPIGFSQGGIELLNILAFRKISDAIAKVVFLATPVNFGINKNKLIRLVSLYSQLAWMLPVRDYHALNIVARQMAFMKTASRSVFGDSSPDVFKWAILNSPLSQLMGDVFHVQGKSFQPDSIIPVVSYVLEPLPTDVVHELLEFIRRGPLYSPIHRIGYLQALAKRRDIPPWLVISGGDDKLVTDSGQVELASALWSVNRDGKKVVVPDCGHVDSVYMEQTFRAILSALNGLS